MVKCQRKIAMLNVKYLNTIVNETFIVMGVGRGTRGTHAEMHKSIISVSENFCRLLTFNCNSDNFRSPIDFSLLPFHTRIINNNSNNNNPMIQKKGF